MPLGKFYGILTTFIISSFLHGFEIKVSVVLITIGVFSYLQFAVRDHLAQAFDCCIRVYPCKDKCTHKYKRNNIICRLSLVVLSVLTVLHLIYLGVLMDPSTDEIGIYEKWNNLYFVSFWIMIVNILIIIWDLNISFTYWKTCSLGPRTTYITMVTQVNFKITTIFCTNLNWQFNVWHNLALYRTFN